MSALGLKTDFRDNGLDMFREEMVDLLDADCGAARQEEKRKDLSGGSLKEDMQKSMLAIGWHGGR